MLSSCRLTCFGKRCCCLRYLGFNPTWVRYATSTPDKPDLPKKLLKEDACKPGYWKESFQKYNFGQVLQHLMPMHVLTQVYCVGAIWRLWKWSGPTVCWSSL